MSSVKVAICLPSGNYWEGAFGFQLVCLSIQATLDGLTLIPINYRGGDTAENRNRICQMALAQEADWLMWFDADMAFPVSTVERLLKWDKDIVGCDYRYRGPPFKKIGTSPENKRYPADHVDPWEGLVERGILGLGCVLIRRKVFEMLAPPWFCRTWTLEHATPDNPFGFGTDDSYLFNYARSAGFQVWCDIALTREIFHIGDMAVPWQMPDADAALARAEKAQMQQAAE